MKPFRIDVTAISPDEMDRRCLDLFKRGFVLVKIGRNTRFDPSYSRNSGRLVATLERREGGEQCGNMDPHRVQGL